MAVLSESDRQGVFAGVNRDPPTIQSLGITKADLRAAVDAVDQWVDDNASAFNLAIPQPARGALTAKQKAAMLVHVVRRRWEVA